MSSPNALGDRHARRAAEMLRTPFSYAVGYGLVELSAASPTESTELERLMNLARTVPQEAAAHLVEVAEPMADWDMDYQFGLGLDLILAGSLVQKSE